MIYTYLLSYDKYLIVFTSPLCSGLTWLDNEKGTDVIRLPFFKRNYLQAARLYIFLNWPTSEWSAICGTHFGETNDVASTWVRPAAASRSINSIFTLVGTMVFSFCSPSLGPTSTIRTPSTFVLEDFDHKLWMSPFIHITEINLR